MLKRLTIISHVIHYQYNHQAYAYGPYTREIDIWADLFPVVTIAAPLRNEKPPLDCLPFTRTNIDIVPQLERGGNTWKDKTLQILSLPFMLIGLAKAMKNADAIQVRCPGNLGLLGVLFAPLFSRYRVAKYAGQWNGYQGEPLSNRLQRFILASGWWNSPVLVYGNWPGQPRHIKPFFTSMMSQQQVDHAVQIANARQSFRQSLHLLYSGRLVREKRVEVLIDAMKILEEQGFAATLKLVGDGPARQELEAQARSLRLDEKIYFEGAFPYEQALQWNEWADCLLLASRHSEGWPKVVAEAMCYGAIPIAVNHGQLAEMLDGRGVLLENGTPEEFASAIINLQYGMSLKEMQKKVSAWASQSSLPAMRRALRQILVEEWKLTKPGLNSE